MHHLLLLLRMPLLHLLGLLLMVLLHLLLPLWSRIRRALVFSFLLLR